MRRDDADFAAKDLELVYIAKRLKEAKKLEDVLTEAGIDFVVETDTYKGGIVFQTERVGAFFYVAPEAAEMTRELLAMRGYRAHERIGRQL
ncbi:MAG: hypothetical protein ACK5AZ_19200 [Bryobacteraceae bacterium]